MCLNNFSSCNLIGASSSLALLISENLSSDEIATFGAFFTTLGDNLALIAIAKAKEEEKKSAENSADSNFNLDICL